MSGSNLVDAQGRKIQTVNIPVVRYKEFSIPIRVVKDEERVKSGVAEVRPYDIIKEMRCMYTELQDRFVILCTLLSVAAKKDPELDAAMSQMGLKLKDFEGKVIYEPDPAKMELKAPEKQQ